VKDSACARGFELAVGWGGGCVVPDTRPRDREVIVGLPAALATPGCLPISSAFCADGVEADFALWREMEGEDEGCAGIFAVCEVETERAAEAN